MRENALFESHFDLIPFGIYVVDAATYAIIHSNLAFKERFGDQQGKTCYQALYELDAPCRACRMAALMTPQGLPNGQTLVFEHFNEVDDRWYQMQERTMTWPDGRVVKYSIAVDISELKETQNRLAEAHAELALKNLELTRLSTTDMLTGLANRPRIEALARQALADWTRPLSLILLDLDHFKRINDRFGHLQGDQALRALGGLLGQTAPQVGVAGRWGGEEFLMLCPRTNLAQAYLLAEQLREAVGRIDLPGMAGPWQLTCSFGVAEARAGEGFESLVARADEALYAAKGLGRDRVETA